MLVLITYDVNTTDTEGRKRLRAVARKCVAYGQRVQNSVFECLVDAAQFKLLQAEIATIIDLGKDSLRFYTLGNKYQSKVVHIGARQGYAPEETLIL